MLAHRMIDQPPLEGDRFRVPSQSLRRERQAPAAPTRSPRGWESKRIRRSRPGADECTSSRQSPSRRELGLVPDPAFVANVHVHRVERGADAGSSRIDDELRTREEELSAASSGLSRRRRLRSTAPGQAPDAAGQRRLPFLFAAVAFNAATRAFGFFKRHYAAIQLGAGVVLVAVGYLVLTGELLRLNIEAGTSSASTAAHADVLPPTPCSSACVPGASATLRLRT